MLDYGPFTKALNRGCMAKIKELDIVAYTYLVYKQWYYVGKPLVSDYDFDSLEASIKKYQPDHPVLDVVGLVWSKCKCCKQSGQAWEMEK